MAAALLGLLGAGAIARAATYGPEPRPAPAPAQVGAYGNPIFDAKNLAFRPAAIDAVVGEIVRWTNEDGLVPHTVTEDHGLFDLAGTYGVSAISPTGFAPGTSVQRIFDAGTYHYYCRVHPRQMHGTVSVPVALAVSSRVVTRRVRSDGRVRRMRVYAIAVTWAAGVPAVGQVFDVERRRGRGAWMPWLQGRNSKGASFAAGARGTTWSVRARLRRATEPSAASGWSPSASATVA
jgi:plastocyanin